jgi:putative DNA primase/helicase
MSIIDVPSAPDKGRRPLPQLSPRAGILLVFLDRGPRTWHELAWAGLDREAVLTAVGYLVEMKDLCGGEKLQARRMREDFWEFDPTHKLVMLTNHKPKVTGTDAGAWRRLRLVPFRATYWNPDDHPDWEAEGLDPAKRQDKQLDGKLRAEATGILAWLVRGCLDWQREGLTLPEQVQAATAEYRDSEDVLAQFIAERCVTGGTHLRCKLSELYAAYRGWSDAAGERAMGSKTFSQSLAERNFERSLSNGTWYRGIELRRDEEPTEVGERFEDV